MTEHFKAPEKIELSEEEIANLSDAQFKTLVIRMLTELVEYGLKLEEKMKATLSEIKENVQGTNSDRKETRTYLQPSCLVSETVTPPTGEKAPWLGDLGTINH